MSKSVRVNPSISLIDEYKVLAKTGIVILVGVSALAGYLIAFPAEQSFSASHLLTTLLSICLLSAGSAALNQFQEIETDRKMTRTSQRPLVTGTVSRNAALKFIFGLIGLGAIGLLLLSWKLFLLGALAVFSYNLLYTKYWKPNHPYAAVPGALPGALPILMGAVASSGNLLNPIGIYLFMVLFVWQMPHFWSLAIRYSADYALGNIPTLPVKHGTERTLAQITIWSIAYLGVLLMAPLFLDLSFFYWIGTGLICIKISLDLKKFLKKSKSVAAESDSRESGWLAFFLSVNFSLIFFFFVLAVDLWSHQALLPFWISHLFS